MHANLFVALLVPVSGALARSTCAAAPPPKGDAIEQGTCGVWRNTITQCAGIGTSVWYSPPAGNYAGVLRIRNNDSNIQKIVQLREVNGAVIANYWINGGDECVTNVRMTKVDGFAAYENV